MEDMHCYEYITLRGKELNLELRGGTLAVFESKRHREFQKTYHVSNIVAVNVDQPDTVSWTTKLTMNDGKSFTFSNNSLDRGRSGVVVQRAESKNAEYRHFLHALHDAIRDHGKPDDVRFTAGSHTRVLGSILIVAVACFVALVGISMGMIHIVGIGALIAGVWFAKVGAQGAAEYSVTMLPGEFLPSDVS